MFKRFSPGIIASVGLVLVLLILGGWLLFRHPSSASKPTALTATSASANSGITLSIYSGHTDISAPDTTTWQAGQDGQQLAPGTKVKTSPDSRAIIKYPDGSVTRLDYNSEVTISDYQPDPQAVSVTVESGRVWSRVAALLGKKSYQTQTGSVIASVRGTSYGHDHTRSHDQIITTEHNVDVNCQNHTQEENVPEGFKATFTCDTSTPPELIPLTDADKGDEWYIFNHQQDLLMNLVFPSPNPNPIRVLGVTTTSNSSHHPQLTPNLIDCIGPDGKTARATQADCDNLWQFWNTHPPAEVHRDNPSSNDSSSSTSSKSTPISTPTPPPLTFTNVICQTSQLTYIGCTHLLITGTGFASDINLSTHDDFEHSYPTNSITLADDTNLVASISADLCQADASYFDLTLSYPSPDNRQVTYSNFVPYCFQ